MTSVVIKAILHNLGVTLVSLALAWLGSLVDGLLGLWPFGGAVVRVVGGLLLAAGFLLRVWATVAFYQRGMRVIVLEPQAALLTTGPYRFSRNPLYLGGNVLMFLGAALILGSVTAVAFTILHLPLMDRMVRREEAQLEQRFGPAFAEYKRRVRRWF